MIQKMRFPSSFLVSQDKSKGFSGMFEMKLKQKGMALVLAPILGLLS